VAEQATSILKGLLQNVDSDRVLCCCTNVAKSQRLHCNVVDSRHTCWTETKLNASKLELTDHRMYSLQLVCFCCSCSMHYNEWYDRWTMLLCIKK